MRIGNDGGVYGIASSFFPYCTQFYKMVGLGGSGGDADKGGGESGGGDSTWSWWVLCPLLLKGFCCCMWWSGIRGVMDFINGDIGGCIA